MSAYASRARPRRTAVATEEERAWVSFYRRVGRDPAIALEVLTQLDADAEMKREHLALYLCCRESLQLHEARDARDQRIGRFVRWVLGALFVRLPLVLRRSFGRGGDIAVACLPDTAVEPAILQVQRLSADSRVRAARTKFKTETSVPAAAGSQLGAAVEVPPRAARASG